MEQQQPLSQKHFGDYSNESSISSEKNSKMKKEKSHKHIEHSFFLEEIERRSDFPASYVLGALGLCALLVWFNYIPIHITNIVSIVFPVYWTMKCLENQEEHDRQQWYSYWLIWSYFFILDITMPNFLAKVPLFYFTKLLFFTWLFLPSTQGAYILYDKVFSKILNRIDFSRLNRILDSWKLKLNQLVEYAGIPMSQVKENLSESEDEKTETQEKKPEVQKTPEEVVKEVIYGKDYNKNMNMETNMNYDNARKDTSTSEGTYAANNYNTNPYNFQNLQKDSNVREENKPQANESSMYHNPNEDVQYEPRQNIVGDAKIESDNLKTNLQNVRDHFSQSVERLKEVRENIGSSSTNYNQNQNENMPSENKNMNANDNYNINLNQNKKTDNNTFVGYKDKDPIEPRLQNIYEKKVM